MYSVWLLFCIFFFFKFSYGMKRTFLTLLLHESLRPNPSQQRSIQLSPIIIFISVQYICKTQNMKLYSYRMPTSQHFIFCFNRKGVITCPYNTQLGRSMFTLINQHFFFSLIDFSLPYAISKKRFSYKNNLNRK